MIRTSTQRLSGSSSRLRNPHTPLSSAVRRAIDFNPALELSSQEQEMLKGTAYSLSEDRIARILALAALV